MCDVKPVPEDGKICRGCLSWDRKLASVASDDLCFLLTEDQKMKVSSVSHIALCWECRALLRRTQRFQVQVQKAHTILQDSLLMPPAKPTLSSLTVHLKLVYDDVLEESKPSKQQLFYEVQIAPLKDEKVIIPTKYKTIDITSNEDNVMTSKDVVNDSLTIHVKTEHSSDDSVYSYNNQNFEADDRNSSSSEEMTEIKDKNIRKNTITKRFPKAAKNNLPIVKPPVQNHMTLEKKVNERYTPVTSPLKQSVEENKKQEVPFIKTPAMLKLEKELNKLMNVRKIDTKEVTINYQKKHNEKNSADNIDECCEATSQTNAIGVLNAVGDWCLNGNKKGENGDSDRNKNVLKRKRKTNAELDPDFRLEGDDQDYATDDSEKYKQIWKKKTIGESDTEANSSVKDDETKKRRFRKIITRCKNIADVVPYFAEIEMSEQDIKNTLEQDDAFVDEKKPIKCNICGIMLQTCKILTRHALRNHKKNYPNQFKKGSFVNPPLVQPQKSVWRCSVCARTMRSEHIVAHMNEYHRNRYWCAADGCQWCPKPFWEKEDFDQHWDAIHKQLTCDICKAHKRSKISLEWHIKEAHAPPSQPVSLQCPRCPKTLSSRKALKQHEQSHVAHVTNQPQELRYCVECNFTFKTMIGFQQHFYRVHSGKVQKKWPCEQCGKELGTSESYKRHVDIMHNGKTDFCCHICGKYLSKAQSLQNHLNAHNNIRAPKNKPCAICGRMFQSNIILRLHMHTHTGERPYKCPHCETAFTQPYCLQTHLAKRHGVEAAVKIDGTIVTRQLTDTNNEFMAECSIEK